MFSVTIKGKRISYDINFKSRYSVVIGDSGTGKTFFSNLLMNRKKEPGFHFELSEYDRAIVTPGDALHLLCSYKSYKKNKYLLICDDKDFEFDEDVKLFFEEAVDTYFLLITRNEYIPNLNYGIEDVYTFACVKRTNILVPVYTYSLDLRNKSPMRDDVALLTEDIKVGRQFYEKLFERTALPFAGGKDAVIDYMISNRDEVKNGVYLAVDWCSFGSHLVELNSLLSSAGYEDILVLPTALSFEYLILKTNFFKGLDTDLDLSVKSAEAAYEEKLAEATKGTPLELVHNHTKKLPVCYTESCCSIKSRSPNINRAGCEKGLFTGDKFVRMLKGTEFEVLLYLAGRL